jgi:hypothetical protein
MNDSQILFVLLRLPECILCVGLGTRVNYIFVVVRNTEFGFVLLGLPEYILCSSPGTHVNDLVFW